MDQPIFGGLAAREIHLSRFVGRNDLAEKKASL
jgi:hypothetical protein